MNRLADLVEALDTTGKTSEKLLALRSYFASVPDEDAAVTLSLLTGHRPKRPITTTQLRRLAAASAGVPAWLLDECFEAVGDLSETIALLLPEPGMGVRAGEPLHRVFRDRVLPLAGADERQRAELITAAWGTLGPRERFVYHKLIRGGFRLGVQRRMVARALADVAGVDPAVMAHRLTGPVEPTASCYRSIMDGATRDALAPYPFFLARSLESMAGALGDPDQWQIEWKWDGIRAQLIRRESGVALISRGEEAVGQQFPEITAQAQGLPAGTVLDGEVLLLRPDGSPAPFAALQRRLNRLRPDPQGSLFDQPRVTFRVYDLLEHRGVDIRARPLSERRDLLESQVSLGPVLSLSEPVRAGSWEALDELRRTSRGRGVEGFMLKRLSSRYLVGRADPGGQDIWWKWKVDPLSVDAVLVHAQPGSGRRATLLTDYTFALWDPDSSGRLVTFAKAYSGLTHEEIERLDAILRRTTTGKSGPVRHVEPTQVFEIGFEALAPSDRHRSGIAVRFPRILRWRQDKSPDQADTLAGLRVLLDRYGR